MARACFFDRTIFPPLPECSLRFLNRSMTSEAGMTTPSPVAGSPELAAAASLDL